MTARQPRDTITRCADCGWQSERTTAARAAYALSRHSCDLQRTRLARASRVAARRADPGTVVDCVHPDALHTHGTHAAYVLDRCRCRACRDATAAYERLRVRRAMYGTWQPYVDAQPTRDHIAALSHAGMGWKRVARAAGLAESTVYKIIYGDSTREQAPARRIRPQTAEKILAVKLQIADGARVNAIGTVRRLQALVSAGWSMAELARRLDVAPTNMTTLMHSSQVRAGTARKVATLYDELWDTSPRADNQRTRISVSRARSHAAANGWAPALAWDDNTINDPAATPDLGERAGKPRAVQVVEDVEWLLEQGASLDEAAARLGLKVHTVLEYFRRAGQEIPAVARRSA